MTDRPGERKGPDPLADKLAGLGPKRQGNRHRIDELFENRPAVLESILAASKRGVSHRAIADLISDSENHIGVSAVGSWLKKNAVSATERSTK